MLWAVSEAVLLLTLAAGVAADAPEIISVSRPALSPPAGSGGDSWAPLITPDGRYVLFASAANNLVRATNRFPIPVHVPPSLNVYLRDRVDGTSTLVSANPGGAGGNGDSLPAGVSSEGQYALFESTASDLLGGDTNNAADVFLRDVTGGITILVSVNTNGVAGNGASRSASMTPDGRVIAFASAATDLVADDTNGLPDIFVRDTYAGTTVMASIGASFTNTTYEFRGSAAPILSDDGRYVVFYSTATNLVDASVSGGEIYLRDLHSNTTVWVSCYARTALGTNQAISFNHALSADGKYVAYEAQAGNGTSGVILRFNRGDGTTDVVWGNATVPRSAAEEIRSLSMSPDGRFIAFLANTNLETGFSTCVLLWDAQSRSITLVSGGQDDQVPANSSCDWPVVDPSGRFVAFLSTARGLVPNDLVGDYHLYLRDTEGAQTSLVDADSNGLGSPVPAGSIPQLSAEARVIAFECGDSDLVPDDSNHSVDVFVRDAETGSIELISARHPALASVTANAPSTLGSASLSADGRFVAFSSEADSLVAGDTNALRDVFVRDLANGITALLSSGTNGVAANGVSFEPAISPDGRYVAFTSSADNLVAGDTNKAQDVFVRDLHTGGLTLVSVNTNGTGPGNFSSFSPLVGTGGRYVAFRSRASNLGTNSTVENLFVRDLQSGTTYALTGRGVAGFAATPDAARIAYFPSVNFSSTGPAYVWDAQLGRNTYAGTSPCLTLALSCDGKRLATAEGANLYVTDLATGTNRLLDSAGSGPANRFDDLHFSADTQWLTAVQRVLGFTNHVWLYDVQTGGGRLVDHQYGSSDAGTGGSSDSPVISADGRFVAYRSAATNIVANDINDQPDIFLHDRLSGLNTLLSVGRTGDASANHRSLRPVFSADGCTLLFESWASDLAGDDFNLSSDLFACSFLYVFILPGGGGQGPWLSWPWVSGRDYRVQYKDALTHPVWQNLGGWVTNSGNKAWLQDPSPAPGQRFYRVISF